MLYAFRRCITRKLLECSQQSSILDSFIIQHNALKESNSFHSLPSKLNLLSYLSSYLGDKGFACDQCEKRFRQKRDLVRHMRIHTGEKPYTCGQCDKGFSRKDKLLIHVRSHMGLKLFSCTVCGKTFQNKDSWIMHIETHAKE
ncbi:gastrula zinc finger protein XlCGF8.2DB-like [Uloborus diversus]|uniref:gastrula zinc finger protein XlCGF8.2DB-like n=1 Tax=Uloborus diversus TaxID=327109 RepID=UPI00240A5486|nr:gastrula zinc finger protein XlCGF8.2DB-like [Uloborus diversus]